MKVIIAAATIGLIVLGIKGIHYIKRTNTVITSMNCTHEEKERICIRTFSNGLTEVFKTNKYTGIQKIIRIEKSGKKSIHTKFLSSKERLSFNRIIKKERVKRKNEKKSSIFYENGTHVTTKLDLNTGRKETLFLYPTSVENSVYFIKRTYLEKYRQMHRLKTEHRI